MKPFRATILMLILLFGNMGLTIATHYCSGHAVATSVLLTPGAPGCEMGKLMSICTRESQDEKSFARQTCCTDDFQKMDLSEENVQTTITTHELSSIEFNYPDNRVEVFSPDFVVRNLSQTDISPPKTKDICILIQSFLI